MFSLPQPKWRPCGRESGGRSLRTLRALTGACARFRKVSHSVLCRSAALTPLGHDIHSIRSTSARHPHPSCPQNLVETKAAQATSALRALPLRGPDTPGTRHLLYPFDVGATSASSLPAEPRRDEGCAGSRCAERTTLRNRWQAPARARSLRREPPLTRARKGATSGHRH